MKMPPISSQIPSWLKSRISNSTRSAPLFLDIVSVRILIYLLLPLLTVRSLVRSTIFGHLSWTAQHASGNRGDDFRALKLAELQPWTMLHPNGETGIYTVLGLQGEEKAGKRGMRTVGHSGYILQTILIPSRLSTHRILPSLHIAIL